MKHHLYLKIESEILILIYRNRDKIVYPTMLVRLSTHTLSTIFKLVIKLEKLKLVKREINRKNRRVNNIILTKKGEKIASLLDKIK